MALRGLVLPISGDPRSLLRSFKQSEHAAQQFSREMSKTGVSAKQSAQAQVQAAVRTQARLRAQISEYKQLANTAQRGSREQVAAAHLAARAQTQLAHSIGTTTKEAREFARVSERSQRHILRGTRGAVAGTGAFRGIGRSLAFASGGFLAGFSATAGIKAVINQASILQEETEKTGVLFGKSEKQVQRWSRSLASSFGVSEEKALESAGVFGNMFRSLHFGEEPASKMSERLVQLAADMASFNNTSPEETLKALQSGLAGMPRPLRAYGVFLSQDRIKQEALNSGIAKNASHLTAAQKVQAAYNIILRDTALQHGDVARNTESLSVSQSKLKANLEDSEAIIGRALLPSLVQLANGLSRYLSRLNRTGQLQRSVNQSVRVARSVFAGVRAVIVPVAHALIGLSHALGGAKNTATVASIAFLALKTRAMALSLGLRSANVQARTLNARLLSIGKLGAIGVSVVVAYEVVKGGKALSKLLGQKTDFAGDTSTPRFAKQFNRAVALGVPDSELEKMLNSGILNKEQAALVRAELEKRKSNRKAGLSTEDRRMGRSPGGPAAPAPPGIAGRAGGGRGGRLGLAGQFAKAELALAKAELTAGKADDRASLQQLAALTRQKIAKTKNLAERTQLYQELGSYESQLAGLEQKTTETRKAHANTEKKARNDQLKALQERESTLRGRIKDIQGAFKDAVDTAREGIGELFGGPVLNPSEDVNKGILGVRGGGGATNVKTLTADLNAQVKQATEFQNNLARLQKRGAPAELIKELRAQGIAAAPQVAALAHASPKELAAFEKAFGRREHLAIRTARTTMRAQLVTLHAARVQLRLTRGQERALHGGDREIVVKLEGDLAPLVKKVTVKQHRRDKNNASSRRGRNAGRG